MLTAEGGIPPLRYSTDGANFDLEAVFNNLPAGSYRPAVRDANGCESSLEALIAASSAPQLADVQLTPSDCDAPSGAIRFDIAGGQGPWRATLNGREALSPAVGLPAGDYALLATDALGCADTALLRLPRRLCPIYLPNAFSPNDDGVNDYFAPQSVDGLEARIRQFLIFDRWGGLVYRAEDIAFGDAAARWDGRRKGAGALPAPLDPGVFAYVLELVYPDGEVQRLAGEVLMVR
jgi:gliding motility-associated-like protein